MKDTHRLTNLFVVAVLLLLCCCSQRRTTRSLQAVSPPRPITPEVVMKHAFYAADDSLKLFLRFEDMRQVLDLQQTFLYLQYTVRAGNSEKSTALLTDTARVATQISKADGGLYVSLALPAALVGRPNTLYLRHWQQAAGESRMSMLYALPLENTMLEKQYLLINTTTDRPLFQDYLNLKDKLLLQQFGPDSQQVYLQRYQVSFPPALPPMSSRKEAPLKAMEPQETFSYTHGDTITFTNPGLYHLQPNTATERGLVVEQNAFPMVTTAQELLQPLLYLTTTEERQTLFSATDPRAAVDNFWLKLAGDKAIAREFIRTYYGRVEAANRQYTSHKAGWATDRGMVYIIFGQPSNISRTNEAETWIYRESETSPYVRFVFNKIRNNFTENHYELARHRDYAEVWYSNVAKWRAGIIDM